MKEPTNEMKRQMKLNCQHLVKCHGWSKDDCIQLANEYREYMQTPEGFKTIQAHLVSIENHATEALFLEQ